MTRTEHAKLVQSVTEISVITLLEDAGYDVECMGDRYPCDLIINGTLRVEIKGALWTKHKHSKGRYQFNTRQDADLYILGCMTHAPRYFVVPGHVIAGKTNVAIWSEYPSKYVGRWTQYCDAWHIIDEELAKCTVLDTA